MKLPRKISAIALGTAALLALGGCAKEPNPGDDITRSLPLTAVDGLNMRLNGQVFVQEGPKQLVTVTGPQNVLDALSTEVTDGNWDITFRKGAKPGRYRDLLVEVTVPRLRRAGITGGGAVEGRGEFHSPELEVFIDGAGRLVLNGQTEQVRARIKGAGLLELKGSTKTQDVDVDGYGAFMAMEMSSEVARVKLKGGGTLQVKVSSLLEASGSGSGSILYRGSPTVNSTYSGRLKQGN